MLHSLRQYHKFVACCHPLPVLTMLCREDQCSLYCMVVQVKVSGCKSILLGDKVSEAVGLRLFTTVCKSVFFDNHSKLHRLKAFRLDVHELMNEGVEDTHAHEDCTSDIEQGRAGQGGAGQGRAAADLEGH